LKLRQKFQENIEETAQTFSDASWLCKILGYEKRAIEYLVKSYELRKSLEDTNSTKLAKVSYQIGLSYSNLKKHETALDYKFEALNIWRSNKTNEDICIAKALNSIAVSYNALGKNYFF
jgi:tetratricopeptide (TPR) repeat protein